MNYTRNQRGAASPKIGIVVLAAGASSRMGEAKQLLGYQGKTLLRRAVETALESAVETVVVVLGANFERTITEIQDYPVAIAHNADWQEGLASSIKIGLESLLDKDEDVSACLVMLADQPFVTKEHLDMLAKKFLARPGIPIVAAKYENTIGVPAVFSAAVFDDLRSLAGDEGAKKVIKKYGSLVRTVNLPEAAIDIDTPADLEKLRG